MTTNERELMESRTSGAALPKGLDEAARNDEIMAMARAIHRVRFPRATHGEVYPASWNMAHAAYEAGAAWREVQPDAETARG